MEKRVLEVLGCIEKKRGEKNGRQWVLYQVHANDEQGNPISQELTSFDQLPEGKGEYYVQAKESQYGTTYMVKRNLSQQDRQHDELVTLIKRLITMVGGDTPAPAAPAARVVEADGVPF